MSIEGNILGAATVAGSGAAGVAALAHTGHPAIIGIATGLGLIVILGLITRKAQKKS